MSKYTAEYFASVIKATSIASTLTGKDLFSPASQFRNLILLPSPRPAILRVLRSASRRAYRWCDAKRKVGRQPVRVKLGCSSDEKFDRLASESGQSRSPRRPDDAGSVDDCFWDKASALRSSAKQRKQTTACPSSERRHRHHSMTALPSAAESRRSSALGQQPHKKRTEHQS